MFIARSTESYCHERLCLTALKKCSSMRAREQIGFAVNGSQAHAVAAIGTGSSENRIAYNAIFKRVPCAVQRILGQSTFCLRVRNHFCQSHCPKRIASVVAGLFSFGLLRIFKAIVISRLQMSHDFGVVGNWVMGLGRLDLFE